MHQWFKAITAGLALTANQLVPNTKSKGLVSHETLEWVESIREKYDIPGIGLGIIASPNRTGHDWEQETHGFGYVDEHGPSPDGETLFAIASNSKLFVAMSIGLLIDNGTLLSNGQLLGYNTKIKDIYEDWSLVDSYMSDHLDVLDLLSMRSGLARHDFSYTQEDPDKIISRLRHLKPSTEIRQVMQYNNYHYWVLAQIVPRLTDSTYIHYVKTHILDPLDMKSSTYNHTIAERTGHRARSYVREGKNPARCREAWSKHRKLDRSCYGYPFATTWFTEGGDGTFIAGPGGLVSSANDMMKWLKELLEPKIIPKHVVQQTHKSFIPAFGDSVEWDEVGIITYGQGSMIFNYRGHEIIQHGGDVPGFTTQVTRVPALGVGFFTAINDDDVGAALKPTIVYRILDDLLGLPAIDWEERLVTRAFQKGSTHTPTPKEPRPAPESDKVIGGYIAKGYDAINIQPIDNVTEEGALSPAAVHAVKHALEMSEGTTGPLYIANFPKIFAAVLTFSHFDGSIFNTTAFSINEGENGRVIANVGDHSSAVFVAGKGMGMFEDFWGGAKGKRAVEANVEEECEIWFSKV